MCAYAAAPGVGWSINGCEAWTQQVGMLCRQPWTLVECRSQLRSRVHSYAGLVVDTCLNRVVCVASCSLRCICSTGVGGSGLSVNW
jgi:hypothetical protein